MNAGFSHLTWLKGQLLAASLKNDPRWDDMIRIIGLGVAVQIEQYCGRKFMRTVGAQDVFGADRVQFLLSRYPVETPITQVEFKLDEPTGWVTQSQTQPAAPDTLVIRSVDAQAGIIYFPEDEDCGEFYSQMRFTYTGGFYWETLDPKDPGYVDPLSPAFAATVPATATRLPEELRLAWLTQVRHVWETIDRVGDKILTVGSNTRQPSEAPSGLDLVPLVKIALSSFVRYNFT